MAAKVFSSDGIVLLKQASGEASASALVLMEEFGLVRLRAQSARVMNAKMRYALEPMTLGHYSFVRGTQANRLVGASVECKLLNEERVEVRRTSGQIARLLLRLLPGEESDPELFATVKGGFLFMAQCDPKDSADVECMLVLTILSKLGYLSEDATLMRFAQNPLSLELVQEMRDVRSRAVRAINQALLSSGL